jgi:hypothetical protein
MKKISDFLTQLRQRPKRLLLLPALLVGLCILPVSANADVADIILFLKQIETTLQNGIGQVLSEMKTVENAVNTLHQEIVWPLAAISQAKGFVNSTMSHYKGLLNQIHSLSVESATLTSPSHLEIAYRGAASTALSTIQPTYTAVYNPVPQATNANPLDRNMIDMDDAAAVGSLKAAAISDQTSDQMLDLADVIELQAGGSAPGSAPLVETQAQIASLENQAYMAKLLATELRLEATKLAHDNALLKRSADHRGTLQLQMQQVGARP